MWGRNWILYCLKLGVFSFPFETSAHKLIFNLFNIIKFFFTLPVGKKQRRKGVKMIKTPEWKATQKSQRKRLFHIGVGEKIEKIFCHIWSERRSELSSWKTQSKEERKKFSIIMSCTFSLRAENAVNLLDGGNGNNQMQHNVKSCSRVVGWWEHPQSRMGLEQVLKRNKLFSEHNVEEEKSVSHRREAFIPQHYSWSNSVKCVSCRRRERERGRKSSSYT